MSLNFNGHNIDMLRDFFQRALQLAEKIFVDLTFRPYNVRRNRWDRSPQKAFCDAVMVGLSRHLDRKVELVERRDEVVARTRQLFIDNPPGTFTGRGNSKADIERRIALFSEMLAGILAARGARAFENSEVGGSDKRRATTYFTHMAWV
jgi:hypothetical protein